MAGVATLLGAGVGAAWGVTAAYSGGRWDPSCRQPGIVLAFPQLVFALLCQHPARRSLIVLAVAIRTRRRWHA